MTITAILLAAGRSQRFGDENKLTADVMDLPLIWHSLRAVDRPEVDDVIIVVSSGDEGLSIRETLGHGRWRYVTVDGEPPEISKSIKAGISLVPTKSSDVMIALADMPGIPAEFVSELCQTFKKADNERIVCPKRKDGHLGHPVIWPKRFIPALKTLRGDRGARALLIASELFIQPVPCEIPTVYIDIDTPTDIETYSQFRSRTND